MKFAIAWLAMLLAPVPATARDDVSYWETAETCPQNRQDQECVEYQASLELHHLGDEYCGLINETTEQRSPDAWFSGRPDGRGLLVRYVDSFQSSEDAFGWARLKFDGHRLSFTVLLHPYGGLIGDEHRFHRTTPTPRENSDTAGSCAELEATRSGLTVHVPPLPRAASPTRP